MTTSSEMPFAPTAFPTTYAHKAHHQIFQPPQQSPYNSATTSADYLSRSRKRQRPDSSHDHTTQQTPWTATPSWIQCPTPGEQMYMSSGVNVNDKYCLAGGFDTPGLLATSDYGQQEHEWCRQRVRDIDTGTGSTDMVQDGGRRNTQYLCGPLARERNGVARMQSSPNGEQFSRGWASFAFQLVGQVFAFGSGVIRGFYAGGGKGYDLDQQSLSDSWMYSRPSLLRQRQGSTPVPGSWQEEEFLGDFEQDNPTSPTFSSAKPPNKRRQTDKDSWVLVGTPEVNVDLSPKRKSSGAQRLSLGARPTVASRANNRRSLAPVSRRQSSFLSHTGSPVQPPLSSHVALQEVTQNKRASFASTRSANNSRPSSSSGVAQNNTYISPETARLLKRQAKQEKAADKAMSSMSRRLEDLIRQGQEALGTKFSVEGGGGVEDKDEGFVDEEW